MTKVWAKYSRPQCKGVQPTLSMIRCKQRTTSLIRGLLELFRHANVNTLAPNSQRQSEGVFPILAPFELTSRVVPCSGRHRRHQVALYHWHRCTRIESRMHRCWPSCHRFWCHVYGCAYDGTCHHSLRLAESEICQSASVWCIQLWVI